MYNTLRDNKYIWKILETYLTLSTIEMYNLMRLLIPIHGIHIFRILCADLGNYLIQNMSREKWWGL